MKNNEAKELYLNEAEAGQGEYYVSYGRTADGEFVEVRWEIKEEYLEADAYIPEDAQMLCDWETPSEIRIDQEYYYGAYEIFA